MDILQFFEKGGMIVYILIALNILGFTIIFMELFNLYNFKKNIQTTICSIFSKIKNNREDLLEMTIQQEIKKLEFGLNTIKIIATISPLLGLLGTVLGIFSSFDVISKVGLDDPMNFSGGISLALITTIVGLIVSIPHYIFYNYFIGTLDNIEITLKSEVLSKL